MPSKNRIAILVAFLFAVPVAVAALEQAAPSAIVESVESAESAESEPRAEAQPDSQPAKSAALPDAEAGQQVIGTAPGVGLIRETPSDAFPQGSDVEWEIMPALARYLEEVERKRGPLVAGGDVFPTGSDVEWELLPAQIAYFDRLERQHMAAAQNDAPAAAQVSPAKPAGDSRNALQKAADYISGLFKRDSATAPAEKTAAAR